MRGDVEFCRHEPGPAFFMFGTAVVIGYRFEIGNTDDGPGYDLGTGPAGAYFRYSLMLPLLSLGDQIADKQGRNQQDEDEEPDPETFKDNSITVPEFVDHIFHGSRFFVRRLYIKDRRTEKQKIIPQA